ncbi:uncharacterized protein [Dermacentor albipictus]|uniref:uncharacterized protein isoform X2 n=1 Tax=Dermacentor albipictus TaxID=60249 RepID=UPI0038FCAD4D
MEQTPITDGTYNVEGVTEYGSTSYQHLGFIGSIDHARPSTSRTGMQEASASFHDGATIPESMWVHQVNPKYQPAEDTSTIHGMPLQPEEGNIKSCVLSVAMFRAEGTPYRGTPRNTRVTRPTFVKRVISHL